MFFKYYNHFTRNILKYAENILSEDFLISNLNFYYIIVNLIQLAIFSYVVDKFYHIVVQKRLNEI